MKKVLVIFIALIFFLVNSCKKNNKFSIIVDQHKLDYDNEVFIRNDSILISVQELDCKSDYLIGSLSMKNNLKYRKFIDCHLISHSPFFKSFFIEMQEDKHIFMHQIGEPNFGILEERKVTVDVNRKRIEIQSLKRDSVEDLTHWPFWNIDDFD